MELQANLPSFGRDGIQVFAISYDSPDVLREFANRHGITYSLLSDEGSRVIREFGIFRDDIPQDRFDFGVPRPGSFMVGRDGLVFDKSFFVDYRQRESVRDMLQESFGIPHGDTETVVAEDAGILAARANFASPTIRGAQLNVLTVEVAVGEGVHVNGPEVPGSYIPIQLTIDPNERVTLERVAYPDPEVMHLEVIGEALPVYAKAFRIKAYVKGVRGVDPGDAGTTAKLEFQACNDSVCYPPNALTFDLPLEYLTHPD